MLTLAPPAEACGPFPSQSGRMALQGQIQGRGRGGKESSGWGCHPHHPALSCQSVAPLQLVGLSAGLLCSLAPACACTAYSLRESMTKTRHPRAAGCPMSLQPQITGTECLTLEPWRGRVQASSLAPGMGLPHVSSCEGRCWSSIPGPQLSVLPSWDWLGQGTDIQNGAVLNLLGLVLVNCETPSQHTHAHTHASLTPSLAYRKRTTRVHMCRPPHAPSLTYPTRCICQHVHCTHT